MTKRRKMEMAGKTSSQSSQLMLMTSRCRRCRVIPHLDMIRQKITKIYSLTHSMRSSTVINTGMSRSISREQISLHSEALMSFLQTRPNRIKHRRWSIIWIENEGFCCFPKLSSKCCDYLSTKILQGRLENITVPDNFTDFWNIPRIYQFKPLFILYIYWLLH